MRTQTSSSLHQQGAALLIVSMLLLFSSSIVVFYLNRGLIFEQKTSANQVRSTSAQEIAEAGIEWATGMLNTPYDIQATNCSLLSTTNVSFRKIYAQTAATTAISSSSYSYPGCKISGTTLTCNCPAIPPTTNNAGTQLVNVANLGTNILPGFTVTFADVPGDNEAVQLTSTGCTAQAGTCKALTTMSGAALTNANAAATTGASDATATISVILKMRPLIRAAPASALTCGTTCALGGSFSVENFDAASNGITVNSGGATTGTSAVSTIPGLPSQNSVVSNDSSLASVAASDPTCSDNKVFKTYFGSTIDQFAASPATKSLTCSSGSDCGSALTQAYADGWRSFYVPDGFQLSGNNTYGSTADPITLVSPGSMALNGNTTVYGLLFSNDSTYDNLGTGALKIHGALLSCKEFKANGNGNILYDPDAIKNLQRSTAVMVRVPGSWRDFQSQ